MEGKLLHRYLKGKPNGENSMPGLNEGYSVMRVSKDRSTMDKAKLLETRLPLWVYRPATIKSVKIVSL